MSDRYRGGRPYVRGEQTPPPPRPSGDGAVERHAGRTEIAPERMRLVPQQDLPEWDFWRIVDNRHELAAWMHRHWADEVLSGQELIDELEREGEKR